MKKLPLSPLLALTLGLAPITVFAANAPKSAPSASEGVTVEYSTPAVATAESPAQRDARMQWWREAKFGLFIHWGLYAVPAGHYGNTETYGEWIMHSAKIPVAEYRKFAQQFNPVKYDPAQWAAIARDAGMRYIVITSKHHDGFALFPSAASTWNVVDATPYKRDLLAPLVTAAKQQGLKIGFYYSQAQDWNNRGGAKARYNEGDGWDDAHKGSFDDYLRTVAVPQVREILTRYPIDILWWDTPTWMNPQRTAPLAALTSLRPGLITNNRLGAGFGGDTATPEQFVPVTGYKGDWETCMTMNSHWGYNAADVNWKSSADLIHKLAEVCSKGGNFLLNVGPTATGEFPTACVERLHDIGQWLKVNGEAIYGTQASPFAHLSWGVATRKGDRVYLHVWDWPADGKLRVPLQNAARGAWLLSSPGTKLDVTREPGRLTITLPKAAPDAVDSVVVLQLQGEPIVRPLPTVDATATASAADKQSGPEYALDGTAEKRWRAPVNVKEASLEIDLGQPKEIVGVGMDEPDVWPRLRQTYTVEAEQGGAWTKVAEGRTNGHGASRAFPALRAQKFRIRLACPEGAPGLAEVQLYQAE